jgi:predicted RecA/RadA family phage recombinase
MKNFVQNGANLTIEASSAISSGDFVVVGDLVGVAVTDIAVHEKGAIACEGVFTGTKASGATLAVGDVAYLNSSGKLTNTATSNDAVGLVVAVTTTTVDVKVFGRKVA